MNNTRFIQATCDTSKAVGRDNGIKVRFAGDGAYTDGKIINLPSLPPLGTISETQMKIFQGYRDHETLHILCSHMEDFSKNQIHEWVTKNKDHEKETFNCLEDIRIERCANQAYFGMASNIHATNQSLGEDIQETIRKNKEDWKKKGKDVTAEMLYEPLYYGHMITMARARMKAGFKYDPLFDLYTEASDKWKQFADKWADKINAVPTGWSDADNRVDFNVSLDGVKQVVALVPEFIKDVKAVSKKRDKPQSKRRNQQGNGDAEIQLIDGQTQSDTSGQTIQIQAEITGSSQGQAEASDQKSAKGKVKQETSQPDAQPEGSADDSDNDEGEGQGKGFTPTLRYNKDEAKEALVQQIVSEIQSQEECPTNSFFTEKVNSYELRYGRSEDLNSDRVDNLFGAVKNDVIRAKRGLEIALQARNDVDMQSGAMRGRLDSKRLVQAVSGSPYVYRNRKDGKEMDTTVSFLVDTSGSMTADDMFQATKTAYTLCKACESVGCRTEILAFPGSGSGKLYESNKTGEIVFDKIKVVKTFNERVDATTARERLAFLSHHSFGYTPIAEAVTITLTRLSKDLSKKKVLIVLTDGQLDCWTEDYLSKNCKKFADNNDIHIFGIGLNVTLDNAFEDNVEVEEGNLSQKTLARMAQIITEEK